MERLTHPSSLYMKVYHVMSFGFLQACVFLRCNLAFSYSCNPIIQLRMSRSRFGLTASYGNGVSVWYTRVHFNPFDIHAGPWFINVSRLEGWVNRKLRQWITHLMPKMRCEVSKRLVRSRFQGILVFFQNFHSQLGFNSDYWKIKKCWFLKFAF